MRLRAGHCWGSGARPPRCTTLPARRWATGVTGSWGASSLHSEAPCLTAGPAVNGPRLAVTSRYRSGGHRSPLGSAALGGKLHQQLPQWGRWGWPLLLWPQVPPHCCPEGIGLGVKLDAPGPALPHECILRATRHRCAPSTQLGAQQLLQCGGAHTAPFQTGSPEAGGGGGAVE